MSPIKPIITYEYIKINVTLTNNIYNFNLEFKLYYT